MKRLTIEKIIQKIRSKSPAKAEAYLLYKLKNDEIMGFKITSNS